MGDAAEDAYHAAEAEFAFAECLRANGIRRCPKCVAAKFENDDCDVCHGTTWIDADGEPCEP